MGRMRELSQVMEELRHCSKTLTGISETLENLFGGDVSQEANPVPSEPALKLEDVRAVLAEKSRAGHTAEIHSLLQKYGADRLSQLDQTSYKALLAEAEVLKDAT